jgi:hypothetical protein
MSAQAIDPGQWRQTGVPAPEVDISSGSPHRNFAGRAKPLYNSIEFMLALQRQKGQSRE